ncbi:MAG: chorismate lyase [Burkholderiaceae bacterium]|nr:chorismate lyase [Burkholderiaceae bacterium]
MIPRYSNTETPKPTVLLAHWSKQVDPLADRIIRHWLTRPGALTAGLRELGELNLRVVRQGTVPPKVDEQAAIGLPEQRCVHAREICMSINGTDCVVARSVVGIRASRGHWQAIGRLGRRPLADILYDDRRVSRSAFETARIRMPHPLARLASITNHTPATGKNLTYWARRSVFWRGGEPLLVSECFLPTFWEIVRAQSRTNG